MRPIYGDVKLIFCREGTQRDRVHRPLRPHDGKGAGDSGGAGPQARGGSGAKA
jgi:hypothetical protein